MKFMKVPPTFVGIRWIPPVITSTAWQTCLRRGHVVARDCRSPRCSPGPTAAPKPPKPYGSVSHWPDGSCDTWGTRWEKMGLDTWEVITITWNFEWSYNHIIMYVWYINNYGNGVSSWKYMKIMKYQGQDMGTYEVTKKMGCRHALFSMKTKNRTTLEIPARSCKIIEYNTPT